MDKKKKKLNELTNKINSIISEIKNLENRMALLKKRAEADKSCYFKYEKELSSKVAHFKALKSDSSKYSKILDKLEKEQVKLINYNLSSNAKENQIKKNKERLKQLPPDIRHVENIVSQKENLINSTEKEITRLKERMAGCKKVYKEYETEYKKHQKNIEKGKILIDKFKKQGQMIARS